MLSDAGSQYQDLGPRRGRARVIASRNGSGQITRYFIDDSASQVTRLEFEIGQIKDGITGRVRPEVDSYVFSDFRNVRGVRTPFVYPPGGRAGIYSEA